MFKRQRTGHVGHDHFVWINRCIRWFCFTSAMAFCLWCSDSNQRHICNSDDSGGDLIVKNIMKLIAALLSSFALHGFAATSITPAGNPFVYTFSGDFTCNSSYVCTIGTLSGKTLTAPQITVQALGASATPTWNFALGNMGTLALAANITSITYQNIPNGGSIAIKITQGTGSHYTITWGSTVKWAGGTAPTLTATDGAIDMITCNSFAGTSLLCSASLDVK